jgi:hypothetical protein
MFMLLEEMAVAEVVITRQRHGATDKIPHDIQLKEFSLLVHEHSITNAILGVAIHG